jgi:hypothetical protein
LDNSSPTCPTSPISHSKHSLSSPSKKPPYSNLSTTSFVDNPSCPITHSRGKGKSKWYDDEDEIPLAQLKKSRYEATASLDSLSNLEIVAYSLTQLPPIGTI